jgi:DNA topoisomerase-2
MAPKKESVKSIEEKYQKKTPIEHILTRPDTYIGEVKCQQEEHWVFHENKIIRKTIEVPPGLIKLFDEILVNACDHTKNDQTCDTIKVSINSQDNEISVWNNGKGIDIEVHQEHKIYVPELIFGELLTSTNYDDTEKRTTGGRNGYGAKLTNIFSKKFVVETVDGERTRKFVQEFTDNMGSRTKPKITTCRHKSYTSITFQPDLERFGLESLTEDVVALLQRRVYDIAGTHSRIKVYLNDKRIEANNFKKYIELYDFGIVDKTPEDDDSIVSEETDSKGGVIYEEVNDRWKVGVIYHPKLDHASVSFVNSINTYKGGNHVNHVLDNIVDRLKSIVLKKSKDLNVKPAQIKENMVIFVDAVIENPSFTSQTKEELKTKPSEFGSKCEISDKFINKLTKSGIITNILTMAKAREQTILKKTDGKKTSSIKGIPKLEDANWAGTKKSVQCYLILTEGDSAKAMALAGREVVGADRFGVFPLKGKLLNVREAAPKQLLENEEIKNIKKIMGLQQGKEYDDTSELRYGHIILLTDADEDGSHISGLLMNFIHFFWPSLMKIDGFITSLSTPIVKATNNRNKQVKVFYNLTDYNEWKESVNPNEYFIKYYKGLGTSNKEEAKDYFRDIEEKLIRYVDQEGDKEKYSPVKAKHHDNTKEAMTLAFEKTRADDRKVWLMNYDKNNILSNDQKSVTIPQFVHKKLIHFSNEDINRSIPSICDGFKPSQRKILYGTILRRLFTKKDELRVAQLAGFVSDKACYHHGEASLQGAIINMAQNFVGSNNINILFPSGQFGSRLLGGRDSASPRYIHTYLGDLTRYIFRSEDDPVLKYLDDDGTLIEPEWYIPIIPMVLVNGTSGIGTGFSTNIPCHNPTDIIENIYRMMDGEKPKNMNPWYNKFTGKITKLADGEFTSMGHYERIDDDTIHITELPIGAWTSPYKEFLEDASEKGIILGYSSNITDEKISFTISFKSGILKKLHEDDTVYQKMRLVSKFSTKNMHLYNSEGRIQKYDSPKDILTEFYRVRLDMYIKRKEYIIAKLEYELDVLKYKIKFIQYILDKKIIIERQKKDHIIQKLTDYKFPKLEPSFQSGDASYDYLTNMYLFSLTEEKIEELEKKIENKEEELRVIKNTSEIEMWRSELDELSEKYKDWIVQQSKTNATERQRHSPSTKRKKKVKA